VPEGAPRRRHEEEDDGWEDSDDTWHGHYAAKVLRQVSVAAIMASVARDEYIGALEAFLIWTLDTLNPTWRTDRRRGRERGDSNLYEWQDQLGRSLADAASRMPAAAALDRLLRPIREQPTEIAMRFLAPFAHLMVCASILDAPSSRTMSFNCCMPCLSGRCSTATCGVPRTTMEGSAGSIFPS